MARRDYDHWNEDADIMWWQEEGRHADSGMPPWCDLCGYHHPIGMCEDPFEDEEDWEGVSE